MEYKIISEPFATAQKLLNQWKHEFVINIITTEVCMTSSGEYKITIVLTREKKHKKVEPTFGVAY